MLVARRGLGAAEIRLAEPDFMAAVRWAYYAEQMAAGLPELRSAVAVDPADSLAGRARMDFIQRRKVLREELAMRERLLYPNDD